jgi:hypothetical protein
MKLSSKIIKRFYYKKKLLSYLIEKYLYLNIINKEHYDYFYCYFYLPFLKEMESKLPYEKIGYVTLQNNTWLIFLRSLYNKPVLIVKKKVSLLHNIKKNIYLNFLSVIKELSISNVLKQKYKHNYTIFYKIFLKNILYVDMLLKKRINSKVIKKYLLK